MDDIVDKAKADLRRLSESDHSASLAALLVSIEPRLHSPPQSPVRSLDPSSPIRAVVAPPPPPQVHDPVRELRLRLLCRNLSLYHARRVGGALAKWSAAVSSQQGSGSAPSSPAKLSRSRTGSQGKAFTVQDYEAALTDSRVAIEDLTKDKLRNLQDMKLAWEAIKQLKRENATLAAQVQGFLKQQQKQHGHDGAALPPPAVA